MRGRLGRSVASIRRELQLSTNRDCPGLDRRAVRLSGVSSSQVRVPSERRLLPSHGTPEESCYDPYRPTIGSEMRALRAI
jgi:hypothetical protein